jgi:hypothetical protein
MPKQTVTMTQEQIQSHIDRLEEENSRLQENGQLQEKNGQAPKSYSPQERANIRNRGEITS